jgi:hypothetical protein
VSVLRRAVNASPAVKFVVMVGVMSFFADFTYEGSRSITGPYLGLLGAGAFTISVVSGAGEFIGYNVRLLSGRGADRTGRYWPITIFGYILQMSVIPLVALVGTWQLAAVLIIAERIGKGIRNPAWASRNRSSRRRSRRWSLLAAGRMPTACSPGLRNRLGGRQRRNRHPGRCLSRRARRILHGRRTRGDPPDPDGPPQDTSGQAAEGLRQVARRGNCRTPCPEGTCSAS